MAKYTVKKATNVQFRWTLKAGNGEILITSETYVSKQSCLAGIASSRISVADSNFKRLNSVRNEPYFNQIANNYQVLGASEMYSSSFARDMGIESVKKNAPIAIIEDLT
ncbi:YegP family protein [Algoriphagus sp. CAU 1675]|uniref:YegP family protein n=1 Tax=Algoriphagus sp. CAU 1675 TaxID=3032597 RepID=UPI0023D9D512|nr:YegP family protein [Algoriphagus sp. CAU 1675]MDF2159392.1 YegP family protein [Algoriphagus sp. CAU 1675]